MNPRAWAAAAWFGLGVGPAFSATLHVCPDGTGDYSSLQAALAAASSGDTIELCDGIFTGPENVDLHFGERDIVLRSIHGPENTTINFAWSGDGGGGFDETIAHPGIFLVSGTTTRIEGVTLRNAGNTWPEDWATNEGSAVHCLGGSLTLERVRIDSDFIYGGRAKRGGGVFIEGGALTAVDCEFTGNHAQEDGGAIFCDGSTAELIRCSFVGNGGQGASVRLDGGSVTDCLFEDGHGYEGPGVALFNHAGSLSIQRTTFRSCFAVGLVNHGTVLVRDCLFEDNVADFGVGITNSGEALVQNSTFRGNLAGIGVSAVESHGHMTVEDCLFLGNSSAYGFWSATIASAGGELILRRCSLVGNQSRRRRPGSGIHVAAGASVLVENTVVALGDNTFALACDSDPASVSVTCSDFFGNEAGDWAGCVEGLAGTAGNISADPLFCDTAAGDVHLRASSPCAPPQSGACGVIGAYGVGCGTTALQPTSWGQVKGLYR